MTLAKYVACFYLPLGGRSNQLARHDGHGVHGGLRSVLHVRLLVRFVRSRSLGGLLVLLFRHIHELHNILGVLGRQQQMQRAMRIKQTEIDRS